MLVKLHQVRPDKAVLVRLFWTGIALVDVMNAYTSVIDASVCLLSMCFSVIETLDKPNPTVNGSHTIACSTLKTLILPSENPEAYVCIKPGSFKTGARPAWRILAKVLTRKCVTSCLLWMRSKLQRWQQQIHPHLIADALHLS